VSSFISGSEPGLSPARYLAIVALTGLIALAVAWAWVADMPLAYLAPEYPAWLAKERMLAACDVGSVLVLGDSRAAAGLVPRLLPGRVVNLAVGGGEPIEAYTALRRALMCPRPPRLLIVSFDATHFTRPDLFWERSVAYGFVGSAGTARLRRVSAVLGDGSVYDVRRPDGLPPRLRAALYSIRFPALYFAPLLHGGVFLRYWENRRRLRQVLASRGQDFFGTAPGSSVVAAEGTMRRFRPLPVLDWYFRHLLRLAAARGIPVDFIAMPMNAATGRAVRPAVRRGFAAYLAGVAARDPDFRVIGPVMPHWPDRFFGDGFSHLNPAGARRYSAAFAGWLGREEAAEAQRPRNTGRRFSMKEAVASR
jgi:hypothetical protein